MAGILIGATAMGGWSARPALLPAAPQESSRYLAIVASHRSDRAPGTGDVTMITVTPSGGAIFGSIPTTGDTVELAAAPDGRYAIALNQNATASIITGFDRGQPEESRILPVGAGPNAVAIAPDGATAIILTGFEDPPTAVIIDGLPDSPEIRARLPIPGAVPGIPGVIPSAEFDIALFPSGESAAIGIGCNGFSLLDGILTETPAFRPGSPFAFGGCIQGLAVAPDGGALLTASLLSGVGYVVSRIGGLRRARTPFPLETSPVESSTLSNLRLAAIDSGAASPGPGDVKSSSQPAATRPDALVAVAPGFQGIFVYHITDFGISPPTLIRVADQRRAAEQGGVAISPDGRLALIASIDTQRQTTLSIVSDLLAGAPAETSQIGPTEMVNTRQGAQQSIAFVPLPEAPAFAREEEPNDAIEQANLIVPDVTVLATLDPSGDADYFGFDVEAGQRVAIETRAQRLSPPSTADTVVTLFDSEGNVLAENDDAGATFDSRVALTIPASGRYFFRVRDSRDKGGMDFNYEALVALRSN